MVPIGVMSHIGSPGNLYAASRKALATRWVRTSSGTPCTLKMVEWNFAASSTRALTFRVSRLPCSSGTAPRSRTSRSRSRGARCRARVCGGAESRAFTEMSPLERYAVTDSVDTHPFVDWISLWAMMGHTTCSTHTAQSLSAQVFLKSTKKVNFSLGGRR